MRIFIVVSAVLMASSSWVFAQQVIYNRTTAKAAFENARNAYSEAMKEAQQAHAETGKQKKIVEKMCSPKTALISNPYDLVRDAEAGSSTGTTQCNREKQKLADDIAKEAAANNNCGHKLKELNDAKLLLRATGG